MRYYAIDFETELIRYPDSICPKPICMSVYDGVSSELYSGSDMSRKLKRLLRTCVHKNAKIIMHNASFDLTVAAVHFPELYFLLGKCLKQGMIHDTMIREKLKAISTSGDPCLISTSLAALTLTYLGNDISESKAEDSWRYRYSELDGIPLTEWPEEATEYAKLDAVYTYNVFKAQELSRTSAGIGSMNTEELQVAASFYLRMMTINGIALDRDAVDTLYDKVEALLDIPRQVLINSGIMDSKGRKKLKVFKEFLSNNFSSDKLHKTAKGSISVTSEHLTELAGQSELVDAYIEYMSYEKLRTTYLPQMQFDRIHPDFNVIVKTGRTSCRASNYHKDIDKKGAMITYPSMNIQNLPRAFDVRPCFIPDPGYVFVAIDYSQLELCAIAQTCRDLFGHSDLMECINGGLDLHTHLAVNIYNTVRGLRITYEEFKSRVMAHDPEACRFRTMAKPVTLGVFGGQGAKRIAESVNAYLPESDHIDCDTAAQLKELAMDRYSEAPKYFKWLKDQRVGVSNTGEDLYAFEVRGRYHNNRTYCSASNGKSMQALSSDGAKMAVCAIGNACLDIDSSLYGSKPCAFIHDEIIIQIPKDDNLELRIDTAGALMLAAMKRVLPNIEITVEASVMERWYKSGPFILEKTYTTRR